MSSQQVQYLQKQLQRRDAQIQVLFGALDGLTLEKELSESVACAFAWDFVTRIERDQASEHSDPAWNAYDSVLRDAEGCWLKALEAVERARTATEIALMDANK